jgi:hypothetical protein
MVGDEESEILLDPYTSSSRLARHSPAVGDIAFVTVRLPAGPDTGLLRNYIVKVLSGAAESCWSA